ncbi:uncharacterized protein JCM15063_000201 [Sporobolomyces koalae]|uniref:uncharacterized protein n=1 Tax=Sporobolomyces koalae TaxID=500713 RepID=UPI0031751AD1
MVNGSTLSPSNLAIGAAVSLFEVTTLGQPLEVLKTHMAANRTDNLRAAIQRTYERGGFKGFYQGLVPWGWIESSTAGGILLFTSAFVEDFATMHGISKGTGGLLGGMAGGAAQAYLAMGICTTMKTAEITRARHVPTGLLASLPGEPLPPHLQVPSSWTFFRESYKAGGLRAINKGVNAVALRQVTNWGSRIGIARASEEVIRDLKGYRAEDKLGVGEKVLSSALGGILGCWNHPIEVVRVEMQSLNKASSETRPAKLNMLDTLRHIYTENGINGLFRGVTPRIALSTYRTVCLVSLGDYVRMHFGANKSRTDTDKIAKMVPTQ